MERKTKQREIIYLDICNRYDHPTTEMIYDSVRKRNPSIGLATVYRTVKVLTDEGLIQKITIKDGSVHYDYNRDQHCHLVCTICNTIIDVDINKACEIKKEIEGFKVLKTDLQIHGICKNCQKKGEN